MTANDPLGEPIVQSDLDAYVDGQLSAARRTAVEAYLASRPDAAARVMADLSLRGQLRQALGSAVDGGEARETREAARRLERALRTAHFGQRLQKIAAVGLLVAGGWAAGSALGPFRATEVVASEPPPAHVEEAVRAHETAVLREAMQSQPEGGTYDPEEIRAATAIVLPELPRDWTVVDAQIFPSRFGPSVELAIATPSEGPLSLFAVRPGAFAVKTVATFTIGSTQAASWQIGDVAYALVAARDGKAVLSEEAERLSRTLY